MDNIRVRRGESGESSQFSKAGLIQTYNYGQSPGLVFPYPCPSPYSTCSNWWHCSNHSDFTRWVTLRLCKFNYLRIYQAQHSTCPTYPECSRQSWFLPHWSFQLKTLGFALESWVINYRIQYKLAVLTFDVRSSASPHDLSSLINT